MAFLYIDSEGNERTRHSYSAGLEFDHCPLKYYLHRVMGWNEKATKAALLFGIALEDSIQFFHGTGGRGGEEEFIRLWSMAKDKDLVYTKKERNWEGLLRAGREMMRLYAIRQPSLPIPMNTLFQRKFTKEVFPNNEKYGGIEFFAKLDMIAHAQPDHPMLPKVQWKASYGMFRPVIIDIKTSGVDLDSSTGIVAHDLQLRIYSWVEGTHTAAFLWFKKSLHGYKKGYSCTMLEDAGPFKAGDEVVVAYVDDDTIAVVKDDVALEEMNLAQGRKEDESLETTKVAKERAAQWRALNAVFVRQEAVTRQRLQFSAAMISKESALDAGKIVAGQIVRIVNAWETNNWVNTFSVRFPHDDRKDNYFRAFVLRDGPFRDSVFEQKAVEDLSDYFDEPEEAE
jgi:PD-(D/E)XK nuclease superfamily